MFTSEVVHISYVWICSSITNGLIRILLVQWNTRFYGSTAYREPQTRN